MTTKTDKQVAAVVFFFQMSSLFMWPALLGRYGLLITTMILGFMLFGLIPALIARAKGRDFFTWWVYGSATFLVAIIHSLFLSEPAAKLRPVE